MVNNLGSHTGWPVVKFLLDTSLGWSTDVMKRYLPLQDWTRTEVHTGELTNAILLKQWIHNILFFDILIDLILLLLVYLRFYSGMSDRLSFYFKQHKRLCKPSFDCFLTCSIIKVTCNININSFDLLLKDSYNFDRLYTFMSHKQTFCWYGL